MSRYLVTRPPRARGAVTRLDGAGAHPAAPVSGPRPVRVVLPGEVAIVVHGGAGGAWEARGADPADVAPSSALTTMRELAELDR